MTRTHPEVQRLYQYLRKYPRLLLYFYMPKCPYCKKMYSRYRYFAEKENFRILKINAEKYEHVAQRYSVTAVPRLIFIDHRKIISRSTGSDNDDFQLFKTKVRKYLQE